MVSNDLLTTDYTDGTDKKKIHPFIRVIRAISGQSKIHAKFFKVIVYGVDFFTILV
jgi:hypothetical protein